MSKEEIKILKETIKGFDYSWEKMDKRMDDMQKIIDGYDNSLCSMYATLSTAISALEKNIQFLCWSR